MSIKSAYEKFKIQDLIHKTLARVWIRVAKTALTRPNTHFFHTWELTYKLGQVSRKGEKLRRRQLDSGTWNIFNYTKRPGRSIRETVINRRHPRGYFTCTWIFPSLFFNAQAGENKHRQIFNSNYGNKSSHGVRTNKSMI